MNECDANAQAIADRAEFLNREAARLGVSVMDFALEEARLRQLWKEGGDEGARVRLKFAESFLVKKAKETR